MQKVTRAFFVALVIALPLAFVGLVYKWVDDQVDINHQLMDRGGTARTAWLALGVGILVAIMFGGWLVKKHEFFGALIDKQNRYSLARLQVTMWTAVVLSAWLAIVLVRISTKIPFDEALKVDIPATVLVAMGISVGSFAFANGIGDSKRKLEVSGTTTAAYRQQRRDLANELTVADAAWQAADDAEKAETDATAKASAAIKTGRLKKASEDITAQIAQIDKKLEEITAAEGLLVQNPSPADASAADFFRGDEVGEDKTLDFGKVQMLWITVAIIAAYVFILSDALGGTELFTVTAGKTASLPDLPESIVALLGISHGGYLAVKASNSQKTENA